MAFNSMIAYEYEQLLIGNREGYSPYWFKYGDNTSENNALEIIRVACERYLRWTPEEVRDKFNKEVADRMKLTPLLKYIKFPDELDSDTDYFYISRLLYPDRIHFNEKELILRVYKNVLSGKLKKFPKEYLSGTRGIMRAGICFQYMLNKSSKIFTNEQEMYKFFTTPAGTKMLKRERLLPICMEMYESPLDYLHESLPSEQKSEYWYEYYKFMDANKKSSKSYKTSAQDAPETEKEGNE